MGELKMQNLKNISIFILACVFALAFYTLMIVYTPVAFWLPLSFVNNCVVFMIFEKFFGKNQKM
jgi:hypothetical protein